MMKTIMDMKDRVSRNWTLVLVAVLFAANMTAFAQYPDKWKAIEKDNINYKCAIVGKEYKKGADMSELESQLYKDAYTSLAEQIQITITDKTALTTEAIDGKTSIVYKSQKNFSTNVKLAYLNREQHIDKRHKTMWVIVYIEKEQLEKSYRGIVKKANELVTAGDRAKEELNYDAALNDYYKALLIYRTLPSDYQAEVYEGGRIESKMQGIFTDVDVTTKKLDGSDVQLHFTSKSSGKPINQLCCRYNGDTYVTVKNGNGLFSRKPADQRMNLYIRYKYLQSISNLDEITIPDDMQAEDKLPSVGLGTDRITVEFDGPSKREAAKMAYKPTENVQLPEVKGSEASKVKSSVKNIAKLMQKHQMDKAREFFTDEGYALFDTLLHYGSVNVLEIPKKFSVTTLYDTIYVVRSLPVEFKFRDGKKSFTEQVVFTFSGGKNPKVTNLAFSIGSATEKAISSKDQWDDSFKQSVIMFIEDYRTAYALKRTNYLESIYSNDAIIITGHVIEKMERESPESDVYRNHKYVKLTQQTKEQYIRNLKRSFKGKEYINIRFGDCSVRSAGDMVGIQIQQEYYSDNYNDAGYLYLQVKLTNNKRPEIKVRVWQDKFNPDLGRQYGIQDFTD